MKILFYGDSITDMNRFRDHEDGTVYSYGVGYPNFVVGELSYKEPTKYAFINRGISGNRIVDLYARVKIDVWNHKPDVLSILIGVNDVWHHFSHNIETTPEYFESNLRKILSTIKETMGAKLVMIEPFLLYGSDKVNMLEELDEKIRIERALAQEYADAYLPMQAIFAAETLRTPYTEFSGDGVHPNAGGAGFIAQKVLDTIEPLMADL